VFTVR